MLLEIGTKQKEYIWKNILYNCMQYIYENLVKVGICNKPEEYLYSNYKHIEKRIVNEEYLFIDI